jgi:chromosome partition protein MukB
MIAAYVVLLPDMSKLRFTNLGETSAIGGDRGIWGRLGESGRPSYAVLDLELADGERLVAGVRLTRASEPTVEPTAFVITGLGPSVRLSDILRFAEAADVTCPSSTTSAAVAREGGAVEVFRTIKDYWRCSSAVPCRCGSPATTSAASSTRCRTSMTGGSRAR